MQSIFCLSICTWLSLPQRINVENCLRTLVDLSKNRGIAIPNELETQVLNMFQKPALMKKNTRLWLSGVSSRSSLTPAGSNGSLASQRRYINDAMPPQSTNRSGKDKLINQKNDRSIIDAFQDIVSRLEERLKPLVMAELSVLVDVFYKPETLFSNESNAKKLCNSGGFISKLIKHTEKLMEGNDEKLCIKVLQTLKEMMHVNPNFDDNAEELRKTLINRFLIKTQLPPISEPRQLNLKTKADINNNNKDNCSKSSVDNQPQSSIDNDTASIKTSHEDNSEDNIEDSETGDENFDQQSKSDDSDSLFSSIISTMFPSDSGSNIIDKNKDQMSLSNIFNTVESVRNRYLNSIGNNSLHRKIRPFNQKFSEFSPQNNSCLSYGPGSILLPRAEMTLHEVQNHLDKEGASNLIVELIMSNPSHSIFVESVELGIALLEGGNLVIQKSIYQKLTQNNNSEKFFKVFYDKMKFAQQEIKSTINVNSSELSKNSLNNEDNTISSPMLIEQIEDNTLDQMMLNSTTFARKRSSQLYSNSNYFLSSTGNKTKLPSEISVMGQILRFLQLLCENHNLQLQNFLRNQNQKANFNLVSETLIFLDRICGSTTGGLGLLGLYINESNVALVNQTLETLTEYCQGPCHENQNCIAMHESNCIDIIIALLLNDINPLGKKRVDLVLELKNNASKLLLAIMESRADSENAERILFNMSPKQLLEVACTAFHQKVILPSINVVQDSDSMSLSTKFSTNNKLLNGTALIDENVKINTGAQLPIRSQVPTSMNLVDPKEVGHNIYILCHQLAQHNKELADLLKNPIRGPDLLISNKMMEALNYYQSHTAQIEVKKR